MLDHGYVELVDHMGSDLTVVNAARVSFEKRSDWESTIRSPLLKTLKPADQKLIKYLAEHSHTSPFRHAVLQFEVYAPLMVMRQIGKYRVGSTFTYEDGGDSLETWNESSRRYVTEEPVLYEPAWFREAPTNAKQGSGGDVDWNVEIATNTELGDVYVAGLEGYRRALANGVCAEQARLFLPAYSLYIRAYWTLSLQAVVHFLQQRLSHDAQWEVAQYARAIRDLVQPRFPATFEAFGIFSEDDQAQ